MKDNLAIIVPTHVGHRLWIRSCLESVKKLGYPIYIAYDNSFWKTKDIWRALPPNRVIALADVVVIRHMTHMRAVGICHFWNMIYGLTAIKEAGFKYVFNINGDCVLEKPEGFDEIINMLGNKKLFPLQWKHGYSGTMGWLGELELMLDFFYTYLEEAFMYSRTTEGRLWYYVKENDIDIVEPVNSPEYHKIPSPGTWYDIVGFRHIHAEHKVRRWKRMEPVEEKYYDFDPPNDIFKNKGEYALLSKYWETREKQYLEAWWDA